MRVVVTHLTGSHAGQRQLFEADRLTVVLVADRYGVDVPLNRRIVEMIGEIEDGKRELGYHNIEEGNAYARELGAALP